MKIIKCFYCKTIPKINKIIKDEVYYLTLSMCSDMVKDYYYECGCGMQSKGGDTKPEAILSWNRFMGDMYMSEKQKEITVIK